MASSNKIAGFMGFPHLRPDGLKILLSVIVGFWTALSGKSMTYEQNPTLTGLICAIEL